MTEGEKRCGLGSFFPMSCRGRAEAFARRLHSRLRSLGSHDDGDPNSSESSWLANHEVTASVTNLQPSRHNNHNHTTTTTTTTHHPTENDMFVDFGIFDTPGSPEEEITESELSKFITNPKDDLKHHLTNLDECNCIKTNTSIHNIVKRSSLDSDSSDGPYFDPPENLDTTESNCHLVNNHVNGISSRDSNSKTDDDDEEAADLGIVVDKYTPSELPSSSECTVSSLSRNISDDEALEESLTETALDEQLEQMPSSFQTTSGWCLQYEPKNQIHANNNVFGAIDLESLKFSIQNDDNDPIVEIEEDSVVIEKPENSELVDESYCSHLSIEHDLIVECPAKTNGSKFVCTLEIRDTDKKEQPVVEDELECQKLEPETTIDILEEPPSEPVTPTSKSDSSDSTENENTNHLYVKLEDDQDHDDTDVEERIPRVRRCSSLKTGKTPPGTPGRKKIVRFADVLGLDLADVRTFMDEVPKIPISAYDDLSGADLTLSDTSLSSASMDTLNAPTKTLVALFQQPGGEANFIDKIRNNHLCLENAIVKDPIMLCVCGTVRVRNLDFNKSVHIRYSLDCWKSFSDLQATYMSNSCDGFSDKFSFTLYVHTLSIGQRLEFAVRFQCKGCQYWDNNGGDNYCFQCMPVSNHTSSYVPITTPDHDTNWAGAAFYYDDNSVNLQTTVQEYVTRNLVAKTHKQMSGELLTAITVLLFACLFIYIQKIICFTSSS